MGCLYFGLLMEKYVLKLMRWENHSCLPTNDEEVQSLRAGSVKREIHHQKQPKTELKKNPHHCIRLPGEQGRTTGSSHVRLPGELLKNTQWSLALNKKDKKVQVLMVTELLNRLFLKKTI